MPAPALHFIGRAAAPERVVRWCRARWPDTLPQGLFLCGPTSLALRRLRDALTEAYGAFQGVRFIMPSALPALFAPSPARPPATPAEMLRVWDGVFDWLRVTDADNAVARWLFPGRNDWLNRPRARYAVARRLIALRTTLAERCLDFGAVAAHPATATLDPRERGRWAALDALESKVREILADLNLEDPADRQLATLRDPMPQPQETGADWQLVMACVPDFMPALGNLLRAAPTCDILVQAAPEEAERFDALGLPCPEWWGKAELSLPEDAIVPAETPADEAACIDAWLNSFGTVAPSELCLGIFDREVMPPLTAQLAQHSVEIFAPEPIALSERPPARALHALTALAAEGRPEGLLPLICLPEASAAVGTDYATLRAAFAELWEGYRPRTLRDAAFHAGEGPLRDFVERCRAWVDAFRAAPVEGARAFLTDLYGRQVVDPTRDPFTFATFEALHDLLDELSSLRTGQGGATPELLAARLADVTLHPVRGGADCAYEGRLEILCSSAPLLILAGLNEGLFPDTSFDDAFLPNAFRRDLGLRNDRTRAARDAYILATACALRAPNHTLLLSARSNGRGDWLKPSRLFFRCNAEERACRARLLFSDPVPRASAPNTETGLAFAENPARWSAPPLCAKLSASSIKRYLASPLEWWLSDALHLGDTAEEPPEGIPANRFGSLMHTALRQLHGCAGTTSEDLTPPLLEAFDTAFEACYGSVPDVELLAARASAHHRLRAMARLEATLRAEGWVTKFSEEDTRDWSCQLTVGERTVTLHGQIDRVDYNATTKTWRIIDYKTGASGKGPCETHYACDRKTGETLWRDFQLPIYRLMAHAALGLTTKTTVELAYVTLPAEGQAALIPFHDPSCATDTETALRDTVAEMLTLGQAPLPAEVSPYGNPLLARLVKPTLPKEDKA